MDSHRNATESDKFAKTVTSSSRAKHSYTSRPSFWESTFKTHKEQTEMAAYLGHVHFTLPISVAKG